MNLKANSKHANVYRDFPLPSLLATDLLALLICSMRTVVLTSFAISVFIYFQADAEQKKKRTFRKFTYRGVDLDQLLDMS